jgi:hypothetical protein
MAPAAGVAANQQDPRTGLVTAFRIKDMGAGLPTSCIGSDERHNYSFSAKQPEIGRRGGMRDVPILTSVNKLARDVRDPFDLLDEIDQSLALDLTPASGLIGIMARQPRSTPQSAENRLR